MLRFDLLKMFFKTFYECSKSPLDDFHLFQPSFSASIPIMIVCSFFTTSSDDRFFLPKRSRRFFDTDRCERRFYQILGVTSMLLEYEKI